MKIWLDDWTHYFHQKRFLSFLFQPSHARNEAMKVFPTVYQVINPTPLTLRWPRYFPTPCAQGGRAKETTFPEEFCDAY